jgi:hypothetical protein
MSIPLDIAFEVAKDDAPVLRFVKLVLIQAIQDKADEITFALDIQREAKLRAEKEQLEQQGRITESLSVNHPKTFSMNYRATGRQHDLPAAPGNLFEPAVRILLNAAGLPYWTKGEVAGEFETLNPESKWRLTSSALDREVRLKRESTRSPGREAAEYE